MQHKQMQKQIITYYINSYCITKTHTQTHILLTNVRLKMLYQKIFDARYLWVGDRKTMKNVARIKRTFVDE